MFTKAPALAPQSPWTWWIEGGGQGVIGDPYVAGLTPPFDAKPSDWGWDVAGGFDYRFNGVWHISGDFRYGANRRNMSSIQNGCIGSTSCNTLMTGSNSATRKETNWVADFMIGRDLGLGSGNSQIKGGLRVAEIRGTTDGSIVNWVPTAAVTIGPSVYTQSNRFTGFGPRLALEGNMPLGGAWSVDYLVGVSGLFAQRSASQSGFTPLNNFGFPCFSGCPISTSASGDGFVFNTDAMLGIAYAITSNVKLAVNYHVDAYFKALRAFDSAGNPTYVDRIYHGPSLRVTVQY